MSNLSAAIDPNSYITKDIKWEDLFVSTTRPDLTKDFTKIILPSHVESLTQVATKILQPVINHFGNCITITSGYRTAELNSCIGGSIHSLHMIGAAADFCVEGVDNWEVGMWLSRNIPESVGQIRVYDDHIHVSLPITEAAKTCCGVYNVEGIKDLRTRPRKGEKICGIEDK